MKTIRTQDAIGMVLGQDLTRIVPGEFKGVAFKKGHVIRAEDVPLMLSMGKDHVYVLELRPDEIHENDAAALVACAVAGEGVTRTTPSEAKVNIHAHHRGMLQIKTDALLQINELPGVAIATLHNGTVVDAGELVASVKIIPLTLPKATVDVVDQISKANPILDVQPFPQRNVGMVVTGNEVYYGRIQDKFVP